MGGELIGNYTIILINLPNATIPFCFRSDLNAYFLGPVKAASRPECMHGSLFTTFWVTINNVIMQILHYRSDWICLCCTAKGFAWGDSLSDSLVIIFDREP